MIIASPVILRSACINRSGMTLLELMLALALAGLLAVAMWTFIGTLSRSGAGLTKHMQVMRDVYACERLLRSDISLLIPSEHETLVVVNDSLLRLNSGFNSDSHARGIHRVEYRWDSKNGFTRKSDAVSRPLSHLVAAQFKQDPETNTITCQWLMVQDDGHLEPLWTMRID